MGLPELWEVWEVQFLLLLSLLLQLLLLVFTECRRFVKWPFLSAVLNGALWLLYQMADSIALYVLGHMSLKTKAREQQQLMAFWASVLLVHLGGQDSITAYALEDNELWLRHLFTLVVQAVGAAFVLCKYVAGGSGTLLAAAVVMFLVGVGKYLERIFALYSSGLENISKFLDRVEVPSNAGNLEYEVPACLDMGEKLLKAAHDLLHVCMGQFVDYKVWPSRFQMAAVSAYYDGTSSHGTSQRSLLLQLVGMQLSLMRDILYTKAAVIHTWHGRVLRIAWTVSVVVAFYLFHQSTMAGSGYSKGDMVVSYILLAGALFLEVASLLRSALSTWTCAWLLAAGWKRLHKAVVYLRRGVRVAQRCCRLQDTIGQHDLFQIYSNGRTRVFRLDHWLNKLRFLDSVLISHDLEVRLLHHIYRMVKECNGEEHILWGYRGQLALRVWTAESDNAVVNNDIQATGLDSSTLVTESNDAVVNNDIQANGSDSSTPVAEFYDGVINDIKAIGLDSSTLDADKVAFHGSILTWHYATDAFLHFFDLCMLDSDSLLRHPWREDLDKVPNMRDLVEGMDSLERKELGQLAKAIRTLSRYMVFLLVERPHLLPSPVRRIQYDSFYSAYKEFRDIKQGKVVPKTILPAISLATRLLDQWEEVFAKSEEEPCEEGMSPLKEMLQVLFGVWVEMLCYAATHCSNDAHARQLGSGTELITVVWLLMTTLYNQVYHKDNDFQAKVKYFLQRHDRKKQAQEGVLFSKGSMRALMSRKGRVSLRALMSKTKKPSPGALRSTSEWGRLPTSP